MIIDEIPKIGKRVRVTLGYGKHEDGILSSIKIDMVGSFITIMKRNPIDKYDITYTTIPYGMVISIFLLSDHYCSKHGEILDDGKNLFCPDCFPNMLGSRI
jgi:hypothetical protein